MKPPFFRATSRWTLLLLLPVGATVALSWTLQRDREGMRMQIADLRTQQTQLKQQLTALNDREASLNRDLVQAETERASTARVSTSTPPAAPAAAPTGNVHQHTMGAGVGVPTLTPASAAAPVRGREPVGSHGNVYFPELFSEPTYVRQYHALARFNNATRQAALFADLAAELAPADLARFKETLVQRETALTEVDGVLTTAAMELKAPLDRMDTVRVKLEVNRAFELEIRQRFGDSVFEKLRAHENGTGARQELMDKLELRLSYSGAPLERAQAAQLIELFNRIRSSGLRGMGPTANSSVVNDAFIAEAKSILQPGQLSGLEEIRSELEASRGGSGSNSYGISTTTGAARNPPPPAPAPR